MMPSEQLCPIFIVTNTYARRVLSMTNNNRFGGKFNIKIQWSETNHLVMKSESYSEVNNQ